MKTFSGFFGRVPMMQHSLAGLVRWRDHLSIGNPAIDAQDRAIFNLVGEIDELWRHGASAAHLRGIADKASHLLDEHFHCEERMLAEVGYPDLAEHAAEHREMLLDLASIRRSLDGAGGAHSRYAGLRLVNFALGVTVGHIINTDSEYCRYIVDETAMLSTGCA
jgi:hemerythrin-like metal-binding protein